MSIEIIPTVVPSSFEEVGQTLERTKSFSQSLHIDVADKTMSPNSTWIPAAGEILPECETMFYEVHLMMSNPERAGVAFASAGAKRIIAHAESFASEAMAKSILDSWRAAGAQEIGIALLLTSPLERLDPFIYMCESVTLMSIASIGTQGIPFDKRAPGRVGDLHARYPDLLIEVDGGIGEEHLGALARSGATRFTEGSAIAKSTDPASEYQKLIKIAESAIQ